MEIFGAVLAWEMSAQMESSAGIERFQKNCSHAAGEIV
jgi:hypothetical protein